LARFEEVGYTQTFSRKKLQIEAKKALQPNTTIEENLIV